jgi:hypothetical protein
VAILVDELREYPDVRLPFTTWCHMASDRDFDELHAFAARLGLRRRWFQRDHYDLPAHGRAAAVALGALEVGSGELLERMAGPRGDRARRRGRRPRGVLRLTGPDGPAVLRYPRGALVLVGGAGCERLARGGAVAVAGLDHAHRLAGAEAHLVLLGTQDGWGGHDPAPFASVTIADAEAAGRLARISFTAA